MGWKGLDEPPYYDLEEERVLEEIRRLNARRVLIQLPEGLRPHAFKLTERLEGTGAEIFLVGDSCYGACDLAIHQAESLGVSLLIHYGHSRMLPDTEIPVLYIEAVSKVDLKPAIERSLPLIEGWERIGLTTTVQHIHKLGEVAELLRGRGMEPHIGKGGFGLLRPGMVTGCNYSSATSIAEIVDGYLFIGGGRFHPVGLALATGKRVVAADPYLASASIIEESEIRRIIMRRLAAIEAAKYARRYCIVVSLKPGQLHLKEALNIKSALEMRGKKAVILCLDEVRAEALNNFTEAEAFIDTACPRIALDGLEDLRKPFLTLREAEALIGLRSVEEVWRY
ncbi:MAG: diphthamide biosynthesis enzyme Dph2 [Candidatus Bathyarchaeia archaeon]